MHLPSSTLRLIQRAKPAPCYYAPSSRSPIFPWAHSITPLLGIRGLEMDDSNQLAFFDWNPPEIGFNRKNRGQNLECSVQDLDRFLLTENCDVWCPHVRMCPANVAISSKLHENDSLKWAKVFKVPFGLFQPIHGGKNCVCLAMQQSATWSCLAISCSNLAFFERGTRWQSNMGNPQCIL